MASFSDNPATIGFNPYIQQLPIQQMAEVGMQKQKQYDEGIQKIQSNIDNVAGLDVIRDVDKQYLQSKLNTLGSKLKTVAAGDFSNYQLTSSVGGMVTSIAKDHLIQNAVGSTSNYRKQSSIMEEARGKGELAPENEHDYNLKSNSYLNSDKPGELFNSKYTPFRDVSKKLFEIGKEVGLDEYTVQQLFQTDSQGNVLYDVDSKGNKLGPKFNPIMVEKHLKGRDMGKILSTFKNALTAADYNQLAITGKYVKRNLNEEGLSQEIISNYSKDITSTSGKIQSLKIDLDKENSKNNKNIDEINSLSEQIKFFENQQTSLQESRDRDIQAISKNPDGVRANLYTNNYLTSIARGLSTTTEETKNLINPMFTITMEQNKFNRDLQRDRISDQHWATEQRRADRKENREDYKLLEDINNRKLDLWLKYRIGTPPPGFKGVGGGINEPIRVEGNQMEIIGAANDDYSAGVETLNKINYDITLEFFKRINPKNTGENLSDYENRLKKGMYDISVSNKETIDPASGGVHTFTARFAGKQLEDWKKNPKDIPFEMRDLLSKQNELTKDLIVQKNRMSGLKQQAIKEAKEKGLDVEDYAQFEKNVKPTSITLKDGNAFSLSKQDVVDMTNLHPEVFNTFGKLTIDKQQEELMGQSRRRLELKYGADNLSKIETSMYGIVEAPSDNPFGGTHSFTTKVHPNIKAAGEFIQKSNYGKVAAIEAQLYIDKGFIKQPKSFPILRGDENKDDMNAKLSAIISKYNLKADEQQELLASIDKGRGKIIAVPGISNRQPIHYELSVTDEKGKTKSLSVDEGDFSYLTGNPAFANNATPKIIEQIEYAGTSSLDGTNNPKSTWWSMDDFKNLKGVDYTITADLVPDMGNPNNLWFKLYIHNKNKSIPPIPLTYDKSIPKFLPNGSLNQDVDRLPEGINASVIEQLLKKK